MSELSDQIEACKARRQRFADAATQYVAKGNAKTDAQQVSLLCAKKILPPIPNEDIAAASEIAFPRIILNLTEAIQRGVVAEYRPVTMFDLRSQRRTAKIVRARQVGMFLCREMTSLSLPEIGRRFGGRDHTTVLHGCRKILALMETNPALAERVNRIKENMPEVSFI